MHTLRTSRSSWKCLLSERRGVLGNALSGDIKVCLEVPPLGTSRNAGNTISEEVHTLGASRSGRKCLLWEHRGALGGASPGGTEEWLDTLSVETSGSAWECPLWGHQVVPGSASSGNFQVCLEMLPLGASRCAWKCLLWKFPGILGNALSGDTKVCLEVPPLGTSRSAWRCPLWGHQGVPGSASSGNIQERWKYNL